MAFYKLFVQNEAKAEIRALPGYMRQRVSRAVRALASEPRPPANKNTPGAPLDFRCPVDFGSLVSQFRLPVASFAVDDLDAAVEWLRAHRIEIPWASKKTPDRGGRRSAIRRAT